MTALTLLRGRDPNCFILKPGMWAQLLPCSLETSAPSDDEKAAEVVRASG